MYWDRKLLTLILTDLFTTVFYFNISKSFVENLDSCSSTISVGRKWNNYTNTAKCNVLLTDQRL